MRTVTLGYKARDIHELACHYVAESAGLYASRSIAVDLRDTRTTADEELSVACGAAAVRWLRGEAVKVVFAATAKPMFWLYAREDLESIEDLRHRRIAGYPEAAPPAQFLQIVLEDSGLVPGRDVALETAPGEDARTERLRSGAVAAALLSSATLPRQIEEQGFRPLLCLGDHIQLPTTGLAVSLTAFNEQRDIVDKLRDSFGDALRLIHGDDEALPRALREAKLVDERDLDDAIERLRRHFTSDGKVAAGEIESGLRRLARVLGSPVPDDPASLYGQVYRAPPAT